ncbi:MAG: DUF1460 domain-containing protein, partial [Candidatus Aminicenantes bacterium]
NGGINQKQNEKKNPLITKQNCLMDLGNWREEKINQMLADARKLKSPHERMKYIAMQFIDTAFSYESLTDITPAGTLRVRLSAFDCITFGHYMLALTLSKNFDEFITNLVKIRFKDPEILGINCHPIEGNILDFTYNVYLVNAVNRGMVKNCTDEILARKGLKPGTITLVLKPLHRTSDLGGGLVVPKYGIQEVSVNYIPTEDIDKVAADIRTGYMILFVMPFKSDRPKAIFGHGAIAIKGKDLPGTLRKNIGIPDDDNIFFIHATKSRNTEGKAIGVNIAGQETYLDSLIYDSTKPRLLSHYCRGVGWRGVVILRPLSTF